MEFAKDRLNWLEFNLLKSYPEVVHGVFDRQGGTSQGPFSSLNAANGIGDQPDCVKVNRERMAKALNVAHLVFPHQNHGVAVELITAQNIAKVHQADALMTKEKNIGIGVTHADCQGTIFFDPKHHAIAVAHAGWKGSVQNLYAKVIAAMKQEFETDPHQLLICISPSLGPDHAEFENYKHELPQEFWSFQVKPHFFNFWDISKSQLVAAGVAQKNIEIARICSYCSKDYYSYRRDQHQTGRNATIAALK